MEFVEDREEWALGNMATPQLPEEVRKPQHLLGGARIMSEGMPKGHGGQGKRQVGGVLPTHEGMDSGSPLGQILSYGGVQGGACPHGLRPVQEQKSRREIGHCQDRELCSRHLDTKRCGSLGKVDYCGVRGCIRAHSSCSMQMLTDWSRTMFPKVMFSDSINCLLVRNSYFYIDCRINNSNNIFTRVLSVDAIVLYLKDLQGRPKYTQFYV